MVGQCGVRRGAPIRCLRHHVKVGFQGRQHTLIFFDMTGFALDIEQLMEMFTQVATPNGLKTRMQRAPFGAEWQSGGEAAQPFGAESLLWIRRSG